MAGECVLKKASLTYYTIVFSLVLTTVSSVQLAVHFVANDPLVSLLPGDGCGQVLDFRLHKLIRLGLWISYLAALFSALSFAMLAAFGWGSTFLLVTAPVSIVAFLAGGATNLWYFEHLHSCDMFFLGRDASYMNFGAAVFLLILTAAALYKNHQVRG